MMVHSYIQHSHIPLQEYSFLHSWKLLLYLPLAFLSVSLIFCLSEHNKKNKLIIRTVNSGAKCWPTQFISYICYRNTQKRRSNTFERRMIYLRVISQVLIKDVLSAVNANKLRIEIILMITVIMLFHSYNAILIRMSWDGTN